MKSIWYNSPIRYKLGWADLLLYAVVLFYFVYLIFTDFYKPPWAEDHLVYALTAATENFEDFLYWINHTPGYGTERLAVLYSIHSLIPFFGNAMDASVASVVLVHLLLIAVPVIWVHLTSGAMAGVLASVFLTLTMKRLLFHATELLADPYAALFILLALIAAGLSQSKDFGERVRSSLVVATGVLIFSAMMCKLHYGFFFIVFSIPLWWNSKWKIWFELALGGLIGLIGYAALYPLFYPWEIARKFPEFLFGTVLNHMFFHGVGGNDTQTGGFAYQWFRLLFDPKQYPLVLVMLMFVPGVYRSTFSRPFAIVGASFIGFVFLLSIVSNFFPNWMYHFLGLYFLALTGAVYFGRKFESLWKSYPGWLPFVILAVFMVAHRLGYDRFPIDLEMNRFHLFLMFSTTAIGFFLLYRFESLSLSKKHWMGMIGIYFVFQSFLIHSHNYPGFNGWRDGYDLHHQIFGEIDLEYVRKEKIFVFLSILPKNKRIEKFPKTMLGTRVHPPPLVHAIRSDVKHFFEGAQKYDLRDYEVIITDRKDLFEQLPYEYEVLEESTIRPLLRKPNYVPLYYIRAIAQKS